MSDEERAQSEKVLDLGEDDGYLAVRMGDAEVRLDAWQAHARLVAYHEAHKQDSDEAYHAGLVELIEGLGLPRVSHRLAQRFVRGILAWVANQKKTSSAPAGSPASTASTPAD